MKFPSFLGLSNLARLCLYLFFVFLPFQIGVVVFSSEVFYSGFFNPYLSHWIYLSDLFLILSFVFFLFSPSLKFRFPNKTFLFAILSFVVFAFLSLVFSSSLLLSLLSFFRILEFFALYLLLSSDFYDLKKLLSFFVFSVSFVAFIGVSQYFLQHSLGLSFLGEPVLNSNLLGVSKLDFLGMNYLRVYGTFPHPNIFAAYLLLSILISFYTFNKKSFLFFLVFSLCCFALIFTFSRSAFLAFFFLISLYGFVRIRSFWKYSFSFVFLFISFLFLLDIFPLMKDRLFFDFSGFSERILYFSIAKNMFLENIFGVGLSNFTLLMQDYSSVKLMPWLYQPVHNSFFLILNEIGLQGFLSFVFLLFSSVYFLFKSGLRKNLFLISYFFLLFILLNFDHYFVSLYQGQVLLWFYLGLVGRFESI